MKKAILINDTSEEHHIGSINVIKNIEELCKKNDLHIIKTFTRKDVKANVDQINYFFAKTNYVIVNGEGSLHHSPDWFLDLVKLLPKHTKNVLINTIWQKMYFKDYSLLDKFHLISVRESASYREMQDYLSDKSKISVVPDVIFYTDIEGLNIGYGDSVMGSVRESMKEETNYFPLHYINNMPSLEAYISWLKSLDLYVTGRFHGVCFSAMAGTPFLSFPSNSHKIEGILEDMDCKELLITSFDEIKDKKEIAKRCRVKATKYAKYAKYKIEKLFKKIKELSDEPEK